MRLHILVEGSSEKAFLDKWLPRFLPAVQSDVIVHKGKGRLPFNPAGQPDLRRQGLLDQLPAKLRAYAAALDPATNAVLVLVDADDDECTALKQQLEALVRSTNIRAAVAFCIAIEEMEAFYLGEWSAVEEAFPEANRSLHRGYRQDSVCGTWEKFSLIVGANMKDKVGWATAMGQCMSATWPNPNKSPSFQYFCRRLRDLVSPGVPAGSTEVQS